MDLDDDFALDAEELDCGFYHGILSHKNYGWETATTGHWETADGALHGGLAFFDQNKAQERNLVHDFAETIPDTLEGLD